MSLTPKDIQVTGELANVLYDFLPGKPHPYADSRISFSGVATQLGLASSGLRVVNVRPLRNY